MLSMSVESHDQERSYFYERAEEELEQAQHADHPAAVKAHYVLAGLYFDHVFGEKDGPQVADRQVSAPAPDQALRSLDEPKQT
jgi:hypothetical protein